MYLKRHQSELRFPSCSFSSFSSPLLGANYIWFRMNSTGCIHVKIRYLKHKSRGEHCQIRITYLSNSRSFSFNKKPIPIALLYPSLVNSTVAGSQNSSSEARQGRGRVSEEEAGCLTSKLSILRRSCWSVALSSKPCLFSRFVTILSCGRSALGTERKDIYQTTYWKHKPKH